MSIELQTKVFLFACLVQVSDVKVTFVYLRIELEALAALIISRSRLY
jgi:hypothetical protein